MDSAWPTPASKAGPRTGPTKPPSSYLRIPFSASYFGIAAARHHLVDDPQQNFRNLAQLGGSSAATLISASARWRSLQPCMHF